MVMNIVVTSSGDDLDAPLSPIFGRCPSYIFVDSDTLEYEALPNPAAAASGGAGIQAAQFVAQRGVEAVLTGNVGPNAFSVLASAGISIYLATDGTVRETIAAYKEGKLQPVGNASAPPHAGMGRGTGRGRGRGRRMVT